MRAWLLVAVAMVGCKKHGVAPSVGSGSGSQAVAVTVPADAAASDAAAAVAVDAAAPDGAPVTATDVEHILGWETIGSLKLGMDEAAVVKRLGAPSRKAFPVEEAATGEFVGEWNWPGVALGMGGEKRSGPFKLRSIAIRAPSKLATSRGIHIGSTLAEVEAIYPRNTDEGRDDPNEYLVGSVYGGMLLTLQDGKVHEIFLGAMAF